MNARQLKDVIIVPTCNALGLNSPGAVALLLGTAAHESKMGTYLVQVSGPAIGIYQCEPVTYHDIWDRFIEPRPSMKAKVRLLCGYDSKPSPSRMASDLILATIIARLKYASISETLPAENDILGLASYWKRWYNTPLGRGTEKEFIDDYHRYALQGVQ